MLFALIIILCSILRSSFVQSLQPEAAQNFQKFIHTITDNQGHNLLVTSAKSNSEASGFFSSTILFRATFDDLTNFTKELNSKINVCIIEADNIENLNFTLAFLVRSHVYSSYSTFLVLTANSTLIDKLAQKLWAFKLLRSYMLLINQRKITAFKVQLWECGVKVRAKKIASFLHGEFSLKKLQINMKESLQGCPLFIITGYQPPFVNPPNNSLKGMFIDLLDVLGESSQRNIIIRPYNGIYMEEIIQSYSFDAMIEDFESGYADIFLGSIQLAEMEILDISPILASNDLMMLIPRKLISDPIDLVFSTTFHIYLPLLLVGIFIMAFIFFCMVKHTADQKRFKSIGNVCLIFSGMAVSVATITRSPHSATAKVFFGKKLNISSVFFENN